MRPDAETNAEIDALNHLASAVVELLERLRTTNDPGERHALRTKFTARVDGLRAGIGHRHGLDDRCAEAIVARALAYVGELGRATTSQS